MLYMLYQENAQVEMQAPEKNISKIAIIRLL